MPADPEYVARKLKGFDSEIMVTEQVIASQERDLHDSRKRLDRLNEEKAQFERDVASVGGAS